MAKKEIKQQWNAPSESSDKTYKVTNYEDDTWACGCLGWTRHVPRKDCKHIRDTKDGYLDDTKVKQFSILPASVRQTTLHDENTIYVPLIPISKQGTDMLATVMYDLHVMGVSWRQITEYFKYVLTKRVTVKEVINYVNAYGRCFHKEWIDGKGWTGYAYQKI